MTLERPGGVDHHEGVSRAQLIRRDRLDVEADDLDLGAGSMRPQRLRQLRAARGMAARQDKPEVGGGNNAPREP